MSANPDLILILCACLGASAAQPPATAPSPSAPPQPPAPDSPPDPLESVTVVAPSPTYKSTVDRRSYSLADDLQKNTGSLADVLRDVPAVQVDFDGKVSLRGDPDVTILVDGKPSALFSGPGRAQALQSMSADQFDRVEVMTIPPAGVTAEGSGGVINLISKAAPKAGAAPTASGTVKADVGSGDRFDMSASGAYSAKGLSLTGGGNLRRTTFLGDEDTLFGFPNPAGGALVPAEMTTLRGLRSDNDTLYATAGYDLGPHDHIDASLNTEADRSVMSQDNAYRSAASAGPLALDYAEPASGTGISPRSTGPSATAHVLSGDSRTLSLKLDVSAFHVIVQNGGTYGYEVPVQPNLYQDLSNIQDGRQLDLKIDYKAALPDKAKLTLGYEGKGDWQEQRNYGVQGDAARAAVAYPGCASASRSISRSRRSTRTTTGCQAS